MLNHIYSKFMLLEELGLVGLSILQVGQNDDLNNCQPEMTELSEAGTEQEQDAASMFSETK